MIRIIPHPNAICALCRGRCCKSLPGGIMPQQLGETADEIVSRAWQMVRTGKYAWDAWDGDPIYEWGNPQGYDRVHYLRPATKGKEGQAFDYSWGGECTFLGENGCTLPREERPAECLALKPALEDFRFIALNPDEYGGRHTLADATACESDLGKRELAIAWRPFQAEIDRQWQA